MANDTSKKSVEAVINTSTVVGSRYAQLARVTVTDIDVTIEFAFINPSEPTNGQVVSRVTLPQASGIELAKTILQIKDLHEKKKKGEHND